MFHEISSRLRFPDDCAKVLHSAWESLRSSHTDEIMQAGAYFLNWESGDPLPLLTRIAEESGIPAGTVMAITLLSSIEGLKQLYQQKGIAEDLMWDTLIDVTCKLQESYDLDGIWGTESVAWYQRLFSGRIIKLGRLEFEPIRYKWDTPYQGIHKGDPVLNIHIPSTGSMPMDQVMDSFKRAYAFFRKDFPGNVIPFVGASWLLYPPICEDVLKKGSNLEQFYRLFTIVEQYVDPENKNFWRIFNMHYAPDVLDKAPADTSLRKHILEFMKAGNDMGVGRGVLLFDGENILHI